MLHEPGLEREISDQAPEDVDVHDEEWEEERVHEEGGNEPDEEQEKDEHGAFFVVGSGCQELAEMGVGDLADHKKTERHRISRQIAEILAEGPAAFFGGGEEDDGAERRGGSRRRQPCEDVAALLFVHRMYVVCGEPEGGASEVDAAEDADGDEFACAFDVPHVMCHDGDERGGGNAERGHVGEGVHLDAVDAGCVQEAGSESVEHVEDHGEEDQSRAPGEDRSHCLLVADVLVRLKRDEDRCISAEGVAEREAVRNEFQPAQQVPGRGRGVVVFISGAHCSSFAAVSSASA